MSDPSSASPLTDFRFDEQVAACDVCGGSSFTSIDREAEVVQCGACGYRFVNPRPSQAQIAAAYSDPHFYDQWIDDDAGRRLMWAKRLRLVRQWTHPARGKRLLDVGAGIGTFLAMARDEAGFVVSGTEVSTAACELARRRYGLELRRGQAEDLALPLGAFEVVTLWHVLEHVPSPSRLLDVCRRALAPGGLLVIACPNDADSSRIPWRVKAAIMRALRRPWSEPPRYERLHPGGEIHLSHFTYPVLRRLLGQRGFEIRRVTIDDHYPRPTWRTALKVRTYRTVLRGSGVNLGEAMLIAAWKSAGTSPS